MSEPDEALLWAKKQLDQHAVEDFAAKAHRIGYRQGQAACAYAMKVLEEDVKAARLEGIRLGLEAAAVEGTKWFGSLSYGAQEVLASIRALDPETIAREATLDQLTREAQAQGMGYDKENTR
ncbi:MAG: hypothetical protein ACK5X3_02600 [Pseudomonadota bacterium]